MQTSPPKLLPPTPPAASSAATQTSGSASVSASGSGGGGGGPKPDAKQLGALPFASQVAAFAPESHDRKISILEGPASGPDAARAKPAPKPVSKAPVAPVDEEKARSARVQQTELELIYRRPLAELRAQVADATKAGAKTSSAGFEAACTKAEKALDAERPDLAKAREQMDVAAFEARQVVRALQTDVDKAVQRLIGRGVQRLVPYARLPVGAKWQALTALCKSGQWGSAKAALPGVEALLDDGLVAAVDRLEEIATTRLPWVIARAPSQTLTGFATTLAQRTQLDAGAIVDLDQVLARDFTLIERQATNRVFDDAKDDAAKSAAMDDMSANKVIRPGALQRKYRTSHDRPKEYSVECLVEGLQDIVVHAHCAEGGAPKSGNGTHWKYKDEKRQKGATHELTDAQRRQFVDARAADAAPFKG